MSKALERFRIPRSTCFPCSNDCNLSWGTGSKALEKFKIPRSTCFPCSNDDSLSCGTVSKALENGRACRGGLCRRL